MLDRQQIIARLEEATEARRRGDRATAEANCRRILSDFPNSPDALHLLGLLAMDAHRNDVAESLIRQALQSAQSFGPFHASLAMVLYNLSRFADAAAEARIAIASMPDDAQAHDLLASALRMLGEFDEALIECRLTIEIAPNYFDVWLLLSALELRQRNLPAAIAAADRAIVLRSTDPAGHYSKALPALTAGDFEIGWDEFEWRLKVRELAHLHRDFGKPRWNRQEIAGKKILLYCEGGFGDAIQFVRYLPQVTQRAASVTLECYPELYELLKLLPGPQRVIRKGEPLGEFDYACALQSLPFNFHTTLETIPHDVPYLRADPQKIAAWRARLPAGKNIGLAWAGSPLPDDHRSRSLSIFAPLAQVPGVNFVSLQKGPEASQAKNPPAGMKLIEFNLGDFADSAALIENLDLIISVDTSIAHLAGALAKPVWTLISYVPDFRWMLDREDTPWYPTMRLCRQTDRDDWHQPIARIAAALR